MAKEVRRVVDGDDVVGNDRLAEPERDQETLKPDGIATSVLRGCGLRVLPKVDALTSARQSRSTIRLRRTTSAAEQRPPVRRTNHGHAGSESREPLGPVRL